MRLMAEPMAAATGAVPSHVMVLDDLPARSAQIAGHLEAQGHVVARSGISPGAAALIRRDRPDLLVLAVGREGAGPAEVHAVAHELGISLLAVVAGGADPRAVVDLHEAVGDWVSDVALATELAPRAARLLRREGTSKTGRTQPPTGIETFPVIVHDMRTPLNVIGLSLRMIEQGMPRNDPDLQEDLRFVEENFKQIERMLSQLSDYFRLFEISGPGPASEFSPERFLSDVLASRPERERPGSPPVAVRLDVDPTCPAEAVLDPARARIAIQYALTNAVAAANGTGGVRVTARGGPDRWITEIAIDHPPPASVKAVELRPDVFERLCGTAAERRGMDLAIVARITELFGGDARLAVDAGRGTTIVLDWPARLASA